MSSQVQLESQLREVAGLLAVAEIDPSIARRKLHLLADQVRLEDDPFVTISGLARRYKIDRKAIREMIACGEIKTSTMPGGRVRIDLRQFPGEWEAL